MDFLISSGFSFTNADLEKKLSEKTLIKYLSINKTQVAKLTIHSTGPLLASENSLLIFDGSILSEGSIIGNFSTVNPDDLIECFYEAKKNSESVSGTFCICKIDAKKGSFELIIDPLSAYLIFYYRCEHKYAVSNNIYFLEELLRYEKVPTERCIESYIGEIAFGSNAGFFSGINKIKNLEPNSSISGSTQLTVHKDFTPWDQYIGDESYEYYLEQACNDISCHIDTLIEKANLNQSYYDLTGGIDSRIIFAALFNKNLHAELPFRCITRYPHPDGHYAAFLAERYRLKRWGHLHDLGDVMSMDSEAPFLNVFASMGFGDKSGCEGMAYFPNSMHIHGGYGEIGGASPIAKRSYTDQELISLSQVVQAYLSRLNKLGTFSFFTPSGEKLVEQLFTDKLVELFDGGVPLHFLSQAFYIETRNRSHFGVISRIRGQRRGYPDILNNRNLVRAASKLTLKEITFGKVHFDIIRKLGGDDILCLPLADDKWPLSFATGNVKSTLREVQPITINSKQLFDTETKGKDIIIRKSCVRIDDEGRQFPQQFRKSLYYQRIIKNKLSDMPANHIFFRYINRQKLLEVAEKAPSELTSFGEQDIIKCVALGMIWLFSDEKPFGYSILYDGSSNPSDC